MAAQVGLNFTWSQTLKAGRFEFYLVANTEDRFSRDAAHLNCAFFFFFFFFFYSEQLSELFPCRIRRRFQRGLKRKPLALIKRLRKAKKEAPELEKPEVSL